MTSKAQIRLKMIAGGLSYCLYALIDMGLVKMQNFQNSKKNFKYLYMLTPMGISEKVALTTRFLSRNMEEHEAFKFKIEALKVEAHKEQSIAKSWSAK